MTTKREPVRDCSRCYIEATNWFKIIAIIILFIMLVSIPILEVSYHITECSVTYEPLGEHETSLLAFKGRDGNRYTCVIDCPSADMLVLSGLFTFAFIWYILVTWKDDKEINHFKRRVLVHKYRAGKE